MPYCSAIDGNRILATMHAVRTIALGLLASFAGLVVAQSAAIQITQVNANLSVSSIRPVRSITVKRLPHNS